MTPRRPIALLLSLSSLLLGSAGAARAAEADPRTEFEALVRANLFPIALTEEGRLSGKGAEWLVEMAASSQYFLIGEKHGTAEIPALSGALYRELVERGYHYAALEVGPFAARKAEELLRMGGLEALLAFLSERPESIAFLDWVEEARLAAHLVESSPVENGALWGLDQEFLHGLGMHLDILEEMATTQRQRVGIERARDGLAETPFFLAADDGSTFRELRAAFEQEGESRAVRLLDEILHSNHVYGRFTGRIPASRSNVDRENEMKRRLVAQIRDHEKTSGSAPKVFFKFGGFHSAPSLNRDGGSTLGTFVEEWALSRGEQAFNLYMDCAGGRNRASGQDSSDGGSGDQPCPSNFGDFDGPVDEDRAHPFASAVADIEGVWLIDLRPLRDRLRDWTFLKRVDRSLITGFDAYLAIPGVHPATPVGRPDSTEEEAE